MGEQKRRARQFEQETDESLNEDILPDNLFSTKPVDCQHTYECVRDPEDSPVEPGGPVRLVDMKDRVDVFVGARPVGYVLASHTEVLREQIGLPERKGRAIRAIIADVSELTPTFTVCVAK